MSHVNRREFLRALPLAVPLTGTATSLQGQAFAGRLRFQAFGSGPTLMIGSPIALSSAQLENVRAAYISGLVDRYRIVLMDYPPSGENAASFTPDRVSDDMLAVADAVGASRFAWYGFSWGAVVGLQLATRTDRLTALICGGWPPLNAPYAATLAVSEALAAKVPQAQMMVTYYRALQKWPERQAISKLTVPRMTFAGSDDVVAGPVGQATPIGSVLVEHRVELEKLGWTVRLIDGFGHELVMRPDVVVPLIRDFLDSRAL